MFKKVNIFPFLLSLVVISLFACEKKEGYAEPPVFDKSKFVFDADAKDTVLNTKNNVHWWFSDISINKKVVFITELKYASKNVPAGADNDWAHIYKFENDWFIIEKLDNRKIKVSLKANPDAAAREMSFGATVGNAGAGITILQAGKK